MAPKERIMLVPERMMLVPERTQLKKSLIVSGPLERESKKKKRVKSFKNTEICRYMYIEYIQKLRKHNHGFC